MPTEQQIRHFETFGFLTLPRAIIDDIVWITDEYERVWIDHPEVGHDGGKRTTFPGLFVAQRPRLLALIDHPTVRAIGDALLGDGWAVSGGDGNFYSGDTGWHPDCRPDELEAKSALRHLKIAFYLDPLARETGALRVIPGSHRHGEAFRAALGETLKAMPGRDVPAVALDSMPGDLVAFDHRLWHASFGGGRRRRMFTLNLLAPVRTPVGRDAALAYMRGMRAVHGARFRYPDAWLADMPEGCRRRFLPIKELAAILHAEAETPIAG